MGASSDQGAQEREQERSASPPSGEAGSEKPVADRSCRVYVGNIPWEVRDPDLIDHMGKVGKVVSVDIFEDHVGRSKGCGIVQYETPDEAARAIKELTNTQMLERQIFVREDRENVIRPEGNGDGGRYEFAANRPRPARRTGAEHPKQLFVQNLPFRMNWQEVKDLFRPIGKVARANILRSREGRSRGMATVLFEDEDSASKAMEAFNNFEVQGRLIQVRRDQIAYAS